MYDFTDDENDEDNEVIDLPAYDWDREDRKAQADEIMRRAKGAGMVPHFTGGGVTLIEGDTYLHYHGDMVEVTQ